MVAILTLVGKRQEAPDIVGRMLDVANFGNKPQYDLADEVNSLFKSESKRAKEANHGH